MLSGAPLKYERQQGTSAQTVIFDLIGPLTLQNLFDLQTALRRDHEASLTILDLSRVPYMDSAGMGLVINHFVHCQSKGGRMVVTGVSDRVMELFRLTKIDSVLPQALSVEEAEGQV